MILLWMGYCAAVGALLALAAQAAEAALRAGRRPTRWAWAAAIALSIGVPAAAWWSPPAAPPDAAPLAAGPASGGGAGLRIELPTLLVLDAEAPSAWSPAALDRPLALLWKTASAGVLAALLGLGGALHLRRRRWRVSIVDGEPVLLSEDTGPAVVGFLRPRIVLPRWTMDADPARRALLLEHEREHLRAGDPRLLLVGLAAVVAFPFSPAAWWMLRRLRLAIEVDCDARVLARRADVAAYGTLLLEVGRRRGRAALPLVAFSEGSSNLERRIRIMTRTRRPAPALLALFGVMALGAVSLAAAVPPPPVLPPVPASADTVLPRIQNVREISDALDAGYPPLLRDAGVTGTVTVRFRVTAEGGVEDVRVVEASHAAFGAPAIAAIQRARFHPATAGGRPIPYVLSLPLQFTPRRMEARPHGAPASPRRSLPAVENPREVAAALRDSYPPLLLDAGVSGEVHVRLHLAADGSVERVEVLRSTHQSFAAAALRALRVARFRMHEGAERMVEMPVSFTPPGPS